MTDFTEAYDFHGRTLVDREGERIGTVDAVYGGAAAEWALVRGGLFGMRRALVPLSGAVPRGEAVEVAVDRDAVRGAPGIRAGDELGAQAEAALRRHYGLGGDDAMTRSEEELRVGTVWRPRERVRLRKVVVTEHVTIPVRREELRVELEPLSASDGAAAPAAERPAPAPEHEIVLREERPVVDMRVVARERVRMRVETVADSHEIHEEVRRERIGLDPHADRREQR